MKEGLEKLCASYVASREAVQKAFRWDSSDLYSVCANIYCACGQTADTGRLKECWQVIKSHTRPFSKFRSRRIRSLLSGLLDLGADPESRMSQAYEYYRLLKRYFKKTEYLVLTAFLLTDLADRNLTDEKAARAREIFRRMNKAHRLLTNNTDSVFAVLMAFTDKTDDELIADMEAEYHALKTRFSSSGDVQMVAQILAMASGEPEARAQRLIGLYDALLESEIKYGHSAELAPLAALSLADAPVQVLAEEISSVDAFLHLQKYYGKKDADLAQRAMHAVMIVSDQYAGTDQVNPSVMTNTLNMLISKAQASRLSLAMHALEFLGKAFVSSKEQKDTAGKTPSGEADAGKAPEQSDQ